MKTAFLLATLAIIAHAQNGLDVVNGQILTKGLVIVDSPQPNTPEGGDTLQIALDISGNGQIPQPPYAPNVETGILNITMFLYSYTTGLNLTISNGTNDGWEKSTTEDKAWACSLGDSSQLSPAGCNNIMSQESGSTVKHVNFVWPDCLVGNGGADNGDCGEGGDIQDCLTGTARGLYNISVHETFRMNGSAFYTITDLPIRVTNSISNQSSFGLGSKKVDRPECALRNNKLLSPESQISCTTPVPVKPGRGNGNWMQGTTPSNGDGDNNGGNSGNGGSGGGGTSTSGNGDNGGSSTEAPQTGISLTNLVPNAGSRYRSSRGSVAILMALVAFTL